MCGIEDMEELKYTYIGNKMVAEAIPPYENRSEETRQWYRGWCMGVRSRMEIDHDESWVDWDREVRKIKERNKK